MFKYVLKRIGLAFVTAFIILSATFILIKLLPDTTKPVGTNKDIFSYYNREAQLGYVVESETEIKGKEKLFTYKYDSKTTYYYYKVPALKQYARWLLNIVTKWDWGQSIKIAPNMPALEIIGKRLPVSMGLNIIATLLSVPLGILLGIWAALKKNKPTDHVISTMVMILISVPSFVLITFLLLALAYNNPILPSQWVSLPEVLPESKEELRNLYTQKFLSYIIPILSLSLGSIAGYCRFTRAELCEVMSSDYLLLARTKGLTKKQAIIRHALRNAMVPIVPSILAEFLSIMSGSMILENLYGIHGIGSLFVDAMNGKDYNVLFVDMAMFTLFGLLAGILLDVSYGFIDPRIRMGAKK